MIVRLVLMLLWLDTEGDIAIFDATNTTLERRNKLYTLSINSGYNPLFIETIPYSSASATLQILPISLEKK